MLGNVLKFPTEKARRPYVEHAFVLRRLGGVRGKKGYIRVNDLQHLIDVDQPNPQILINEVDIADDIVGCVSCTVDAYGENWGDIVMVISKSEKVLTFHGHRKWGPGANAVMLDTLPVWHFQRAADLNCPEGAPVEVKMKAAKLMERLKKYCDFVYSDYSRVYEYNAALIC